MVPPFQKPDEVIHFQYVFAVIGGVDQCMPAKYYTLAEKMEAMKIAHKNEVKFNGQVWQKDEQVDCRKVTVDKPRFGWLKYLPAILGIKIADFFDYPVLAIYLGRLTAVMLLMISLGVSFHLAGKYKYILVTYSLLPMVWHQVASVSYDAMLLILTPLVLSLLVKTLETNGISWGGWLSVAVVLMMLSKDGYYVFGLTVIMGLTSLMSGWVNRNRWFYGFLLGLVVAIVFGGFAFVNKLSRDSVGRGVINPSEQWLILKRDPGYVVNLVIDTFDIKNDFYFRSFLAYFGWLDYSFDLPTMVWLILGLGAVSWVAIQRSKIILSKFNLVVLGLMLISQIVLIYLLVFIYWTPVGSSYIDGVAGRYFLPLFPFGLFWVGQVRARIGREKFYAVCGLLFVFFVLEGFIGDTWRRYYDFSKSFGNTNELIKQVEAWRDEGIILEEKSAREKIQVIFATSEDDEIGGLQFAFRKTDKVSAIPYRFAVKDQNCERERFYGYFDTNKLLNNEGYVFYRQFPAFKPKAEIMCLEIEPLVTNMEEERYYKYILSDEGKPVINWLFISRK